MATRVATSNVQPTRKEQKTSCHVANKQQSGSNQAAIRQQPGNTQAANKQKRTWGSAVCIQTREKHTARNVDRALLWGWVDVRERAKCLDEGQRVWSELSGQGTRQPRHCKSGSAAHAVQFPSYTHVGACGSWRQTNGKPGRNGHPLCSHARDNFDFP